VDIVRPETRAIPASRPQTECLQAPHNHQDDRSYDILNQKHHAWQEQLAHQPKSQADELETLENECPQDICLRGDVSNTSSIEPDVSGHNGEAVPVDEEDIFQAFQLNMPRQVAHPYPGYCGLCADDGAVKWPGTQDQGQGSAADTLSTCIADAQPYYDGELQRAPRMHPISLPEEEGDERTSNGGPGLGGLSTGAALHGRCGTQAQFQVPRISNFWITDTLKL